MADHRVDDPEVLPAEDEVMSAVPTNLLLPGRRLSGTGSFVSARGQIFYSVFESSACHLQQSVFDYFSVLQKSIVWSAFNFGCVKVCYLKSDFNVNA